MSTTDPLGAADYPIHSTLRPQPRVVVPGPYPGMRSAPSDAIVLFDGTSLSAWRSATDQSQPARWKVSNGWMEVVPGTGNIATMQAFGDVQLHVEWLAPLP